MIFNEIWITAAGCAACGRRIPFDNPSRPPFDLSETCGPETAAGKLQQAAAKRRISNDREFDCGNTYSRLIVLMPVFFDR
jgi:hypothetical protein